MENLEWKAFVKSLETSIVSIMREFYANVLDAINDKVMVRGVFLIFSASSVNPYCGLIHVHIDNEEVIESLTRRSRVGYAKWDT